MTRSDCPFGFRVVGPLTGARRLVDATAALSGHAACAPAAGVGSESYLSAFRFGPDFAAYLKQHGTTKGYAGACWSPWLWLDIDRDDPAAALRDACRLVGFVLGRYTQLDEDDILVFFSGRKGYHVGVQLGHDPAPTSNFHMTCRALARGLAASAGVRVDTVIYDRVRAFRAPNSRHPKTGLHKRRLSVRELTGLTHWRVAELAREPAPFDVPTRNAVIVDLADDWEEANDIAGQERSARVGRPHPGKLQHSTTEFISNGAGEGERGTRLFRAAADLTEFVAVHGADGLVHALLTEPALDSGLAPAEVTRQIACGIERGRQQNAPGGGAS